MTDSFWFYFKDDAINFNANIVNVNVNACKCFKYMAKLLVNTEAGRAIEIFKITTIVVPLKYLSIFWRSLEMPLINCKVELKLNWTNHFFIKSCVVSANDHNNDDAYSINIIFTIKGTELCVPIVTLSAKANQKLSRLLSKGFKRLVYWNLYKTKRENKNTTNEYTYFLE